MINKKKVTVIIPTRNEEGCIGSLIREIPKKYVDEIVVIDGHSTDNTREEAKGADTKTKVFLQRGWGYGGAVQQGAKHARGDILILMDADGSMNPNAIPQLLKKADEGYEYVMGSRYINGSKSEDDTIIRYIGNKFFTWLTNIIHKTNVTDSLYTYNAIPKKSFLKIKAKSKGFEYCTEILVRAKMAGLKFAEVPAPERARSCGKTKVNAFWHGLKILTMILRKYD